MKRTSVVILIVLQSSLAASFAADGKKGPSKEELEKIAARLTKTAQARFEGDDPNNTYEEILKGVTYTQDTASFLPGVLVQRRSFDVGAAVTNQLLQPLLDADKLVIRRLMPTVLGLHRRYDNYQKPRTYRKSQLRALVFPDNLEKLPPARTLQVIERVQKLRQRKLQPDQEIAFRNRNAAKLEETVFRLLVRAHYGKQDEQLLSLLRRYENARTWQFVQILEVLRDEAKDMPKSQAKWWFEELKEFGDDRKYHKEKYVEPGNVQLRSAENSFLETTEILTGYKLYQTAAKLAKPAGLGKFNHPDEKEIKKAIKKRKK